MSDELTREQLEKTLTIDSIMYRIPRPIREVVMVHDASLRSSRDAERERADRASQALWVCGCGWTNGVNLSRCAGCDRAPNESKSAPFQDELYRQVADLATKLNAMTKERDEYKERAKWKHVHDDSLEIELQRQLAAMTQERDEAMRVPTAKLDAIVLRQLTEAQATVDAQLREAASLNQCITDLEAKVQRLERHLAYVKAQSVCNLVAERDQLQATVTAQQEEIGRLRTVLEEIAEMDGYPLAQEDAKQALAASEQRVKELEEFNRGNSTYPVKLQQLIENLKYDTPAPHPELYHHKIIVAFKQQLADLAAKLTASEQRVKVLEGGYANQCKVVLKREAGFQAAIDQLQATVTAQQEEIGRLGDLQAIQDMRYNRVEYRRVTLLQMYHSMDAVMQGQTQEIERLRGELAGILQDWDGPTKAGFTHGEYFATLFSERRDGIERLVSKEPR